MLWNVTLTLLSGLGTTVQIFFLTLLISLPLGLVVAFGSMSKWRPFRFLLKKKRKNKSETPSAHAPKKPSKVAKALAAFRPISVLCNLIVWIVRGTPLMLQLIAFMYVPGILKMNLWPAGDAGRMMATVVAFSINYACYFSVIYRGGIQGVPVGQREAAQVLGMTKGQIFFKVTLLQMIKRIVPPMSNEIITLVKDTSLARVIAVYELTFTGYSFMKSSGLVWPLLYTGVFYLLFVGILTILFNFIERKLSYFR
ncbi:MAG: amino acid ABC transporter permease [Evtepia sp.]|uniref:amino acid ABC transporter permease n=1 Tax=Evtepia sp. TaxID=2773933 RepID=UPI002A766605|nr:amino acid ABC transporter permease [Evtepia sp.]MDY3014118.1 amino acid ABC transporter permease [Evtepia sp.]